MSPKNKPQFDKVPIQPCFPLKHTLFAATVLLGAGLWAYSNSFTDQFIFDDNYFFVDFFTKNLRANQLWEYLLEPGSRVRPVVSLSLAANYAVSGLEVWSYHAFNLAVHLLAALTLYGVVRHTLQGGCLQERFGRAARWLALAVALLWLTHPLQTESVTYIWQRCESLGGLFYLLTLYCVIRGAEAQQFAERPAASRHRRWHALAIMACALGMACKATLVTAPVVVFAYDRIFLAKEAATAWRKRRGLYAGLAATWLLLAALMLTSPPNTTADFGMTVLSPAAYARTQFGVILHYLRLSFWPDALCFDYMWPVAHQLGDILPGALVVGTLVGATLWAWVRHPAWSFPGVWFFIILAPTSSFMPLLQDLAFEHRMYLPLAAVVTLAVVNAYLLGAAFLRRLSLPEARRHSLGKLAAAGALAAATALLGYLTYQRNLDYRDPLAMWCDVLMQRPENWRAHNNVGFELNAQGKHAAALKCFDKALKLNPQFTEAYNNRGAALDKKGDYDGAIADCNMALKLNPQYAEAYVNRGNAHCGKGDYAGAIADYTKALESSPRYAEAYVNRSVAYDKKGDYEKAIADCNKAVNLERSNWQAWMNKGLLLVKIGKEAEARGCFAEGLKINPNFQSSLAGMLAQARAERQALLGKTQEGK